MTMLVRDFYAKKISSCSWNGSILSFHFKVTIPCKINIDAVGHSTRDTSHAPYPHTGA